MTFYKSYKYNNTEYRFDDNGICLGVFVDDKYSDDAKRGFIPQGTKITKETEKGMIEIGGFKPQGLECEDGLVSEEIDTKNKKSNWGGKREGSGRPEGAESQATKDKKIVKEEMKQRIMRSKDALLNSQMNLAEGIQMLFKIETIEIKNKDGIVIKTERQKPELITSQSEIESYLAGDYDDDKDNYYFITTEKPDNKAIDSMFDRAFDKARQNVGLDGGEEGKPIPILNISNEISKDNSNSEDNSNEEED